MNKFKIGDLVLTKYSIDSMNAVVQVTGVIRNNGDKFTPARWDYLLSNNDWLPENKLELWNPKKDLEGCYMKKELKLEIRKRYRDRIGDIHTIVSRSPHAIYDYISDTRHSYMKNGNIHSTGSYSDYDLIEEIIEEI